MNVPAPVLVLAALAGVVAALGVALDLRAAPPPLRPRRGLATGVIPFALAVAVVAAGLSFLLQGRADWNSVRTVIPVALARGLPIYAGPTDGPLWCNIYPPLGFVLQTPAALASTPLGAIRIAQGVSAVFFLGGMCTLAYFSVAGPEGRRLLAAAAALAFALAAAVALQPIGDTAFLVHIDGPALGLALFACAAYTVPHRLWPVALLAAASVGCKQTLAPLPVALALGVLFRDGWPAALRFVGLFAAFGLAIGAALLPFVPVRDVLFSVFTVPARHGFRISVVTGARDAIAHLWPLLLLAPLAAVPRPRAGSPVCVLLILAGLQFPLAVAGYAKFGGGANNFALTGVFLLGAAVVAGARTLSAERPAGWAVAPVLLACLVFSGRYVAGFRTDVLSQPDPHTVSYAALRARPGGFFFPWFPLSHLMAEGRATHQSWGVLDREAAGDPVSDAWLRKYAPPDAGVICFEYPPNPGADALYVRLRPSYPRQVRVNGLEAWYTLAPPERERGN